jgi:ATP-binding cassette subfamily B protein
MTKSRFIIHYLLLNKYSYLLAIVAIFGVNWLQVEIPRYIQMAIDLLGDSSLESQSDLVTNVVVVISFSIAMVGIRILSRMYALNPGRITEAALKNDLFFKLNRLPNSFHKKYPSGKLISIINNDLNGIRLFYGIGFLQLVNVFFALSLTPIWMWRISPSLTLYSVIPILIAFVAFRQGFKKMRSMHSQRLKRLQNLSEQLMNYLSGIDLIKNQQMGDWVSAEITRVNKLLLETTMKIMRIQSFVMPLLDHANNLMKVVILGLGGFYLLQQDLTLGEITAFLSYSVLLALPLMQLGRIAVIYQMAMVSIESVLTVLNSPVPEQDLKADRVESLDGAQTLKVQNLTYRYQGAEEPALKNISFTIEPGKKLGILGSIGSGKSTLVNCINHHLDIDEGVVFWGDNDVASLPRQAWREKLKTMTQEPYLFSDTIEENVLFGSSQASFGKKDVEEVIELSQLKDDVTRFEKGDQTVVGEKGIMLSGGQKQRLSIARALLNPSELLIMDNVLSAVDYDTERKILNGMLDRIKSQSVLIVSHRISALESMDEILVLESGNIIAQGTHESLLKTSDYYRETWQLQQNETEEIA